VFDAHSWRPEETYDARRCEDVLAVEDADLNPRVHRRILVASRISSDGTHQSLKERSL
jgi:hypothetical protein